jgi:predicted CopG family antitoxin
MISISITAEAYEAIMSSLPGLNAGPATPDSAGLIRIWLDRVFVDRLAQMRGPGESYSDVILRLAKA